MSEPGFIGAADVEKSLLGGLFKAPAWLDDVRVLVHPDDFVQNAHREIYALLLDMRERGLPIDVTTISNEVFNRASDGTAYGGISYILSLGREVPSPSNLMHYAAIVRTKATIRRVDAILRAGIEAAGHGDPDPRLVIDRVVDDLTSLVLQGQSRDWIRVSALLEDALAQLRERAADQGSVVGVPTGFRVLDELLAGFQPENLIILAARPGMGKTAFALSLALAAAEQDFSVGVISLEMSRSELVGRLLSSVGRVDGSKLRVGRLSEHEWARVHAADDKIRTLPIYIDDTPGMTLADVRGRARRLKARDPNLGMIVIDYLQLMQGDDPKVARYQQVTDISRGLKILAKELGIPVIALSQLNRDLEKRKEKRPMLSDLRESGAIEQDADVILMLYRDEKYDDNSRDKGIAEVIVAKNRAGRVGTARVAFIDSFASFCDLVEHEEPL